MVRRILRNPLLYGYQNNAQGRRRVELLEYSDEFPPLEAVQALVDELQCRLVVHFYSGPAVTLKSVSTGGSGQGGPGADRMYIYMWKKSHSQY